MLVACFVGLLAALTRALPSQTLSPLPADPTAALLVEVIRVNTSNPPGNEGLIAELLAPRFRALGFEVQIIPTPVAGKSHFIARLRGDGSKKPILLAAHADVVGVEREKWSVDPFAGVVKDGHVYGRGAIDFKGGLAVFARAAMMLAERKVPLSRDVIFLAEADEEGAPYNTTWLARDHFASIDAEFALNEGGWIIKDAAGKTKYVSVSTADKTTQALTITARGTSTHSSMPLPDNAIFALARALTKLANYETPVELTASTKQFFTTLAETSSPPLSGYFRDLVSGVPARVRRADSVISRDPLLHAIMRNTIAPVLLNAGFRSNVIPGSAQATINVRLIPGTPIARIIAELQRVVNDSLVEIAVPTSAAPTATPIPATTAAPAAPAASAAAILESPITSELYQALEREAMVQFPGVKVTPYLFQAGTDAAAWRRQGIPVFGIYPYPITADELTRMHGNDERVSIESLKQGTEMIYRTLLRVAAKP
ncbi:MAG: M20/M25/M40 family metallo-hydrolase [Phycisphaerae bacterium]|nr:M20/M25/M40 family metallo-hydrolase [Gemmatimonadaceae bacterium]